MVFVYRLTNDFELELLGFHSEPVGGVVLGEGVDAAEFCDVGASLDRCVLAKQFVRLFDQDGLLPQILGDLHQLLALLKVEVAVVLVHWVLRRALLGDAVVVDDVVVGLLQHLPRVRHRLQQAALGDPQQLHVHRVVRLHPQEPGIVFDFLLLRLAHVFRLLQLLGAVLVVLFRVLAQ